MSRKLLEEYCALSGRKFQNSGKIPEGSALMVIDMQEDFTYPSGTFYVAEGEHTIAPINVMISTFLAKSLAVLMSRDYHPDDHCSFQSEGGVFPAHCVQGTSGAEIVKEIAEPADSYRKLGANVKVVFKGFDSQNDSFSAGCPYNQQIANDSKLICKDSSTPHHHDDYQQHGWGCQLNLTGGHLLKQSGHSLNSPPDVMSIVRNRTPIIQNLRDQNIKHVFVVGLALDFCVKDTARTLRANGFDVTIVLSGCRAAHIPGFGKFGSGFLTNPVELFETFEKDGIQVVMDISPDSFGQVRQFPFPWKLHLHQIPITELQNIQSKNFGPGEANKRIAVCSPNSANGEILCKRSPFSKVTLPLEYRQNALIPMSAEQFAFIYPSKETNHSLSPILRHLLTFGGFVYIDKSFRICGVTTFIEQPTASTLCFDQIKTTDQKTINSLNSAKRFEEVTLQPLLDAGAVEFCWIHPNEFNNMSPNGSFCYKFETDHSNKPCWMHFNI
jgi:nicotinamidase-related amidase